jgi:hypothetical protein
MPNIQTVTDGNRPCPEPTETSAWYPIEPPAQFGELASRGPVSTRGATPNLPIQDIQADSEAPALAVRTLRQTRALQRLQVASPAVGDFQGAQSESAGLKANQPRPKPSLRHDPDLGAIDCQGAAIVTHPRAAIVTHPHAC